MNERWLLGVLAIPGTLEDAGSPCGPRDSAFFAAVSGAQMIAHGRNEIAAYDDAIAAYRGSSLVP